VKIINKLASDIAKTKAQIHAMKICVATEGAIMQTANNKLLRNRRLKKAAAHTCADFAKEFVEATRNRLEEIRTLHEVMKICARRFGELPKDLISYLEEVKKGFKTYVNSTEFQKYVAYVEKHTADNVYGKALAHGKRFKERKLEGEILAKKNLRRLAGKKRVRVKESRAKRRHARRAKRAAARAAARAARAAAAAKGAKVTPRLKPVARRAAARRRRSAARRRRSAARRRRSAARRRHHKRKKHHGRKKVKLTAAQKAAKRKAKAGRRAARRKEHAARRAAKRKQAAARRKLQRRAKRLASGKKGKKLTDAQKVARRAKRKAARAKRRARQRAHRERERNKRRHARQRARAAHERKAAAKAAAGHH